MTHESGPEEFFEVFREVQESKKKHEEGAAAPGEGEESLHVVPAAPSEPAVLGVSRPVAVAVVVGALLLVVAAYLLGKQHGWQAHAAARKAASRQPHEPATPAPVGPGTDEPELVDGKLFTLLLSGTRAKDSTSVEEEARYLNSYEPFRALGVQAYVWRDRQGRYRLCARGLKGMSAPKREDVRSQIRKLKSRFGKPEYKGADFYAP